MPELPEVETVVRTLEKQIQGRTITKVKVRYDKIITGDPRAFERKLKGETFRQFERRGKYLIFRMDHVTLVSHLRMEGKYYIQSPEDPLTRHMHVIFSLDNGKELRYNDTRKFGRMELLPLDYDFDHFKDLGPEPFDDKFNADYIHVYRKGKKTPLKSLLLDQSFTAGIGNIYADEALFLAGIHPLRSAGSLSAGEAEVLRQAVNKVIGDGIAEGGTTFRDYIDGDGKKGHHQENLFVYHRQGMPCRNCGTCIEKIVVGGRGTHFCPRCQKI